MKTILYSLATFAVAATSHATIQLNEIFLNPPSTDNTQEFIELRSTSSGVESLAGLSLVCIEGDGTLPGTIDFILNLGAFSTGTNGLFLWRDSALLINPAPDPATTINVGDWPVGTGFSGDLENGTQTFLIVSGFTGAQNQDLDTDNNGTIDVFPWASVIDAIGFVENDGPANVAYGANLGFLNFGPDPGYNADVLLRDGVYGNWLGTYVLGTNPGGPYTADPTPGRSGFGANGTEQLTPGSANFSVVPEPGCAVLLAAAGLLLGSRRRRA